MSDLKVILYKENRAPRTIALSTRMVYRTLFAVVFLSVLLVTMTGLAAKFYWRGGATVAQVAPTGQDASSDELGPSGSVEEQNKALRDQIDQLNAKVQNAQTALSAPKDIDKTNPALALFLPVVVDRTQNNDLVRINNIQYIQTSGKGANLTFELHNAHPGESTVKGYIVVLARKDASLLAYPNIMNKTGPYLLDFEKGETFQVARFRMVNAQFDSQATSFQILIFTRNGELLINTMHEVKSGGTS